VATEPSSGWGGAAHLAKPAVGTPVPQVAPRVLRTTPRRLGLQVGGATVAETLASMVTTARRRVLVTVPYVHAENPSVRRLLDRMIDASSRRVACAILLGGIPDRNDAEHLRSLPFPVRRMDPTRSTVGHAKGMVADASVLISSANWSAAGLGGKWEASLRVDHAGAAAYYAAAWYRDWATGLAIHV
jgi:phosphatidylserine/phosphatidylglycerophosphate/cardiolipin synthase-like enzyme